jgi:hypothetical protein
VNHPSSGANFLLLNQAAGPQVQLEAYNDFGRWLW